MKNTVVTNQDALATETPAANEGSISPERDAAGDEQVLGRFSDIAMLAADWFWEMDASLRFTYLSPPFEKVTGLKIENVLGRTREQAFAGRIDDFHKWERVGEALRERVDYSMVWSLTRDDGETRVLRTRGKPLFDAEGRFLGYRGVGSDVTAAMLAQQQLIESENRFRTIINHVTDIVCIVGADGEIKFLNDSVEKILGYRVDELESANARGLAVPEDRERIEQASREAFDNPGRVVSGIYRYYHKDGGIRVLDMTRQCVRELDGDIGASLIVHARDITEQHLAERALKESEERLRDFAETGADWFWEQDENFRFTYLSGNYPNFFRMEADRMIGKTRQEVVRGENFDSDKWQRFQATLEAHEPFYNFEYSFPRADGSDVVVRISGKPKFDENGEFIGYRGTGIDITESYLLSQQLSYQASHDPLTGLVNRREFELRLARVVKSCRGDDSEHALCYIDLDQFKVVNDTCGHDAGDELLRQIAALLKDKLRKRDTIARLGGDEFGLLLERCTLQQANRVAETVREEIDEFRFMWGGRNFRLGASIGVIPIDFSSGNVANVMRSADAACYAAKDAGRNRIHIYSADNFEVAQRHQEMQRVVEINNAFDEGRFTLYQQLIKPLNPDLPQDVYHCEVLVRMIDENGFPVLPGLFMPTAERFNLATQLDTFVFNATLDWLVAKPEVHCTINLSGMSIANEDFLRFVVGAVESSMIDARRICFEITETAAIANLTRATHFIGQLRERGCFFALDDFGSGLSSFAYLKTLPVDFLKIDGFFVRDMVADRINFELVKSINDIGHVMGKRTIAEFVENGEILERVRSIGVDYAQGYGIAMPQPVFIEKRAGSKA